MPNQVCPNGHMYDSKLRDCPYCPKPNLKATELLDMSNKATLPDSSPFTMPPAEPERRRGSEAETQSDPKATVVSSRSQASEVAPQVHVERVDEVSNRKLVGWLVSFDLVACGVDFRIYEGRTKIGRDPNNDIVINDNLVSSTHCVLLHRDGSLVLKDELSTNGTKVNGVTVEDRIVLKNDDEIGFGKITFKVKLI